jgi:hypothetical protein
VPPAPVDGVACRGGEADRGSNKKELRRERGAEQLAAMRGEAIAD